MYIGPFGDGKYLTKPNFDVTTEPAPGTEIKAIRPYVTLSNAREPYELQKGDWRLGEIMGVVKVGEIVKVIRVLHIKGENNSVNLWAQVSQAGK